MYSCTSCGGPTQVKGICWSCLIKYHSSQIENVREIDYGKEFISEQAEEERKCQCCNHHEIKADIAWNVEINNLRSKVVLPDPEELTPHEEIQLREFWKGL